MVLILTSVYALFGFHYVLLLVRVTPFFSLLFKKNFRLFFLNNLECIPVWPITGCAAQAGFKLSILLH